MTGQFKLFKIILLFLIVLGVQCVNAFQNPSKITAVTVYLDGAEISRNASAQLNSGKTELTFSGLSPDIDESSIQISGLKNASILSINYGINFLSKQKQSDSITALQNEVKTLDEKIQYQFNLLSGYNEELSLIQSNKQLGNATEVVSLEKLKTFASYYRTRITELKTATNASNSIIQKHQLAQADIRRQLNALNVEDKTQTGEIQLKLNSDVATHLDLKIKYNIKNAGWFPVYDLKADKINSPINLEYKAHVFQNSGCDWTDVNLVLSTNDPHTNNEKPTVNPKYLNFISAYSNYQSQRATRSYNYKYNPLVKTVSGIVTSSSDGLPLPGANVMEKGTSNGAQTDFDGRYRLKTTTGNTIVYSYVGMKSEELPIYSSIMNVNLDDNVSLDEVVITGYGSNKSRVFNENIAGVQVVDYSDLSSDSPIIRMRGIGSLDINSQMLFVVDGAIYEDDIANIKPEIVKSMHFLKGSAAQNIYGSRAANGVVLITSIDGLESKENSLGVTVETGLTNTRFEISKKQTILSDGDITVIEIDKFSVPATYNYFSAPVLNENVFLTAKIGNWEQYNLLPAEANVYFEGSYSGKTNINPSATTDSLTVSLGVDPNIVVKRTQLNNFKKTTFIGGNKVINRAFEIEIKNLKTSGIQLTVLDRIPKSQNKAIKIEDVDTGNSIYDEDKGILTYTIQLKPGATEKVKNSYAVKFPKGKRVNL